MLYNQANAEHHLGQSPGQSIGVVYFSNRKASPSLMTTTFSAFRSSSWGSGKLAGSRTAAGADVAGRGLQWPCPHGEHPGTPILHMGEFALGLGAFSTPEYRPSAELPDAEYPLVLTTGRVLAQYNARAMTGRTEGLDAIEGRSFIEVNEADADALGVADGDRVRVTSRRGSIETTARVSAKTNPGQTWMPFHFQDGNSNWLTIAALDPVSKALEYKVCAVRVERV